MTKVVQPVAGPITLLALSAVEAQRLRKVCIDSDYGDAKPIFERGLARGAEWAEAATKPAAVEPAKKGGGK